MPKHHPVPEWRKGAFYWRPLLDGREITIYPLLFGAARLCIGPLADEHGYDMAFRYESHGAAIRAADEWDPETDNVPAGFSVVETKQDDDDEMMKPGEYVPVKDDDQYTIDASEHSANRVRVTRMGKRGTILFEGNEKRDVDNALVVEVVTVSFDPYSADMTSERQVGIDVDEKGKIVTVDIEVPQPVWPHPFNNKTDIA